MEKEKISQQEPAIKQEQQEQPKILFSVIVLENGSIIATENGQPIKNVQKIEFYADGQSMPKYSITKFIPTNNK